MFLKNKIRQHQKDARILCKQQFIAFKNALEDKGIPNSPPLQPAPPAGR